MQRPYVDFLCPRGLADELFKLPNYGIAYVLGNQFIYNNLFRTKLMNHTKVNLTKTVFDNGVQTYYTNFHIDDVDHIYEDFGPLDNYTYVTMIANDYCDSNMAMLETLLAVIKRYYSR